MRRCLVVGVLCVAMAMASCGDSTPEETTPTSDSTAGTSSTAGDPDMITVQVFFLDEDAFNVGRPPYTRAVDRVVSAQTPADGALTALFSGPTDAESAAGLRFEASGATSFTALRIEEGTAHVQLVGGCSSGGSTFSVADEIAATLRQFTSVTSVKIYDPDGETGSPSQPGDSIPFCLEP